MADGPTLRNRPAIVRLLVVPMLLLVALAAGCAGTAATGVRPPPPIDEPAPAPLPDH